MRFPDDIGGVRTASLAAIFLLCLGILLYPHQLAQLATGAVESVVSGTAHAAHADEGTPGDGSVPGVNSHTVAVEETETESRGPANIGHLTALLLVVFFGVVLWKFAGGKMWHRESILLLSERRLPSVTGSLPREPEPAFLSVFLF